MKRFLPILLFLACAPALYAAPVLVAHGAGASDAGHTTAVTSSINTTGATFCKATIAIYNAGAVPTLADSKINSWTALTPKDDAFLSYIKSWYVNNPTVGSGHTFTATSAGGYPAIAVQCWSGNDLSSVFDTENQSTGSGNSVMSAQTGSITPSATTNFEIAAAAAFGARTTFAINSSFTISDSVANTSDNVGLVMGYRIGNAGALNPTLSWAESTDAATDIASFKAAAGASTRRRAMPVSQ